MSKAVELSDFVRELKKKHLQLSPANSKYNVYIFKVLHKNFAPSTV